MGSRNLRSNEKTLPSSVVVLPIPPTSTCPLRALVLLGFHYFNGNLSFHNSLWMKVGHFKLSTHIEVIDDFCCHIVSKEIRSLT